MTEDFYLKLAGRLVRRRSEEENARAWDKYYEQQQRIKEAGSVEAYLATVSDDPRGTKGISGHPGHSGPPSRERLEEIAWYLREALTSALREHNGQLFCGYEDTFPLNELILEGKQNGRPSKP